MVQPGAALLAFALAISPFAPGSGDSTNAVVESDPRPTAEYVILVSVDGLRPDAITRSSSTDLPTFYRLRREAAFTDNARTDFHFSNTLPNHVGMLTGRGVRGDDGHNWVTNDFLPGDSSLHTIKGTYLASVFDVAHDAGLSTAAYVSKEKFSLLDVSYDEHNGAVDLTGRDDGRDKLDVFVYEGETGTLVDRLLKQLASDPAYLTFLHLRDPDSAGHTFTWSLRNGSRYMRSIRHVDHLLGRLISAIEKDERLADRTAIVLTADHGGSWWSHGNQHTPAHFTIPFYVWGPRIQSGDLYEVSTHLHDPVSANPDYSAAHQPIRNASAANTVLSLLGLPAVPGSTVPAVEIPLSAGDDTSRPMVQMPSTAPGQTN